MLIGRVYDYTLTGHTIVKVIGNLDILTFTTLHLIHIFIIRFYSHSH